MIQNDSVRHCNVFSIFLFSISSPSPQKVASTIVNNTLGEEEKNLNYGHGINQLKHKIKMFYIHRAIFHTGFKQNILVDVYTRT